MSERLPLISVIVTCHNQEAFIAQALQSVSEQTYTNWECIVVDDGSTDRSALICREFTGRDNRFRYFFQENAGVSSARNKGFSMSTGEFVQFLDGDDYLLPEKLKVQFDYLLTNRETGVCYTNHIHFMNDNNTYSQYEFEVLDGLFLEPALYRYDRGMSIPIHSALFRRSVWPPDQMPFSESYKCRYEDWVFWVMIAIRNIRIGYLDKSLAVYRIHGRNFTRDAKETTYHSLRAVVHIASLLSAEEAERFLKVNIPFFIERYGNSQNKALGSGQLFNLLLDRISDVFHQKKHALKKLLFPSKKQQ